MKRRYYTYDGYYFVSDKDDWEVEVPKKPVPHLPSKAEIRQTFSTTHSRHHVRRGIFFATLEEVKNAVCVYGGSSANALSRTANAMGPGGMLLMLADARQGSSFLTNLLNDVDAAFAPDGRQRFGASWDYDGPGSFHKSSLNIERNENGFELHFSGAYTTDRDEKLAAKLGVEAIYRRATHDFTWESSGRRFKVPGEFFRNLTKIINPNVHKRTPDLLMEQFANCMSNDSSEPYDDPSFSWTFNEGKASIDFINYRVYPRYQWLRNRSKMSEDEIYSFQIRLEDGGITGPARIYDQFDKPYFGAVGIMVSLMPAGTNDVPTIIHMSDCLAEVYQELESAYGR